MEPWGVTYIQIKVKDAGLIKGIACDLNEMKIKPYFQIVSNDGLMISASAIDEWLMKAIDIWRSQNIDVSLQSGKPTPPGCPPGGGCE